MKIHKSVQITGIVMAGIVILAIILALTVGNSVPGKNTVTVSGTATIDVTPDLISVYFSAQTQAQTAKEAGDDNAQIVSDLKDAITALGFQESQIQTQSYNIYPSYDYRTGTTNGYTATHTLKLEIPVNQTDEIGPVVDAALGAGAGISYIDFELTQESQNTYKAEAIKMASQDAENKAQAVASGFNKNLGSLVSVSIDNYNYYPWLAADFSTASSGAEVKEAATSITPSTQQVSASVTAVYKIR